MQSAVNNLSRSHFLAMRYIYAEMGRENLKLALKLFYLLQAFEFTILADLIPNTIITHTHTNKQAYIYIQSLSEDNEWELFLYRKNERFHINL